MCSAGRVRSVDRALDSERSELSASLRNQDHGRNLSGLYVRFMTTRRPFSRAIAKDSDLSDPASDTSQIGRSGRPESRRLIRLVVESCRQRPDRISAAFSRIGKDEALSCRANGRWGSCDRTGFLLGSSVHIGFDRAVAGRRVARHLDRRDIICMGRRWNACVPGLGDDPSSPCDCPPRQRPRPSTAILACGQGHRARARWWALRAPRLDRRPML
jgi:hypothetical protein